MTSKRILLIFIFLNTTFFFKGCTDISSTPFTLGDIGFFGGFLDIKLVEGKIYEYGHWIYDYKFDFTFLIINIIAFFLTFIIIKRYINENKEINVAKRISWAIGITYFLHLSVWYWMQLWLFIIWIPLFKMSELYLYITSLEEAHILVLQILSRLYFFICVVIIYFLIPYVKKFIYSLTNRLKKDAQKQRAF